MPGFTNRGKFLALGSYFRGDPPPATFYAALCTKKNETKIDLAAATNAGGGTVGIAVTGHVYVVGDWIKIEGTTNYNGSFEVLSIAANRLTVAATYVAETFGSLAHMHARPGPNTDVLGDLVEIGEGSGYITGGVAVPRNSTGFVTHSEDDTADTSILTIQRLQWTSTISNMPPGPDGIMYLVLTDDNATIAQRQVLAFWDLLGEYFIASGDSIIIDDARLAAEE